MVLVSGCVGKTVLPPAPPAETTAGSDATPQVFEPARPPEPAQPGQPPPEEIQPGQNQPQQAEPEPPPLEDEETSAPPVDSLPALQPRLGPAASLYHQGEQYLQEGKLSQAEMFLERALRIEPRNPYYWHSMAKIRLRQGKKREAIQCCLKSNSLASGSGSLIRRNKALINRAQAGDTADSGF
ncbi:MAG TPA: hypothetical protein DEB25_06620 [Desulfobulbaceae bacterium]|nr:hypothetical protein [Desulfobulbaceae bacterium]